MFTAHTAPTGSRGQPRVTGGSVDPLAACLVRFIDAAGGEAQTSLGLCHVCPGPVHPCTATCCRQVLNLVLFEVRCMFVSLELSLQFVWPQQIPK